MNSIQIYVKVSASDAVLGDGKHGILPVTVDLGTLSETQRKVLAFAVTDQLNEIRGQNYSPYLRTVKVMDNRNLEMYVESGVASLPTATQEAVVAMIDAALSSKAEKMAERDKKAAQEAETLAKEVAECLSAYGDGVDPLTLKKRFRYAVIEAAGLKDKVEEALKVERETQEATLARIKLAKEKAEADKKEALKTWALSNGSPRLTALIEENFSWVKVAEEEFFAAHTPSGFVKSRELPGDNWVRKPVTKPTLEQIEELRAARKIVESSDGRLTDLMMEWVEATFDDVDNVEKYMMLSLSIVAPTGTQSEVFKKIS